VCKMSPSKQKNDLSKLNPPPANYASVTTLMIRGIPCSFTPEDMMCVIDRIGLTAKYNFFYMPCPKQHGDKPWSNGGYSFINFRETIDAWTCAFSLNNVQLNPARSLKTCTVFPADIQGLKNLKKHFRGSATLRDSNGPVFLGSNGNKKQNRKSKKERTDSSTSAGSSGKSITEEGTVTPVCKNTTEEDQELADTCSSELGEKLDFGHSDFMEKSESLEHAYWDHVLAHAAAVEA